MQHVPVLLSEVLTGLAITGNASCIDGTLGGAGHAEAMLTAASPMGRLLGLDLDPQAIERARERLAPFGERFVPRQGSFRNIAALAADAGFAPVQAVLLDLGVSSFELDDPARGFSFQARGPLDMRMDPLGEITADQLVNELPVDELADLIFKYGEEPLSRRIARAIVASRPLHDTSRLADVVGRAAGTRRQKGRSRTHPATRTFQALRIAVNDELDSLSEALPQILDLLEPGGRLAVITFHSLEDRIVKQFIQRESRDCICPSELPVCRCGHMARLRPITRSPLRPGEAECSTNPRSRSAKLRIAEKLALQ